jgi:hypothetical protein
MQQTPPPYVDITGISRAVMKDNAQETLVNYDGNARPGELVVDLTVDPPTVYVGNNIGQLTVIGSGGGSTTWALLGDKNNANGPVTIALGQNAGVTAQAVRAIAFGQNAGSNTQGAAAIAIGRNAGQTTQSGSSIAIGANAGTTTQGTNSVAIGSGAAATSQGASSVAIGAGAGTNSQGVSAVAVGQGAGGGGQSAGAVALGSGAGQVSQGVNAIAIGINAAAVLGQAANSIVINATGVSVDNTTTGSLMIKPVRNGGSTGSLPPGFFNMAYNPTTGEIVYWS